MIAIDKVCLGYILLCVTSRMTFSCTQTNDFQKQQQFMHRLYNKPWHNEILQSAYIHTQIIHCLNTQSASVAAHCKSSPTLLQTHTEKVAQVCVCVCAQGSTTLGY